MRKTIVGTALATAAAAVVGSISSRKGVETWYPTLRKPPFNPPNVAFPIAWTTLYADIAVTSAATIDRLRADSQDSKANAYIGALGANLVLNAGWSWVFFGKRKLGPAVLGAGALAISSADLARRAGAADPKLGAALAPYPLWCSFATLLSFEIWRRNR
ncbi:tryptophan-rich sensory protein [Mycobacterium sp. NBC_00419]|uniref:TspO/MBR family protein n=1 Tax=Mycobacterium sp. NBC_00419 TaxID=2975989 RepID=UPI002E23F2FD